MSIHTTLHGQAEWLREEDKLTESLALLPTIICEYQIQKNYKGICDALQGAFLCYKHLFWQTNDSTYALVGHHHVLASYDIATAHSLPVTFCHFTLGESYMLQQNYTHSITHYTKALESYGVGPHTGHIRYHLGEAHIKNGDKEIGEKLMLQGLAEIRELAYAHDEFVAHVWESGCLLRLYSLFYTTNTPDVLRTWISSAQRLIDSDNRLVIRKRQLKKILEDYPLP